jgi:SHOCT-like domain
MTTSEERLKILKMIQEGKITAEEGVKLMEALESSKAVSGTGLPLEGVAGGGKGNRWFRVRVTELGTGKTRVNVRLPVNLINAGLKMGARFSPEVQGLDMEQLKQYIQSGETGKIVDVYDDDDGEHVEVFIE